MTTPDNQLTGALLFKRSNGGFVKVSDAVSQIWRSYKQDEPSSLEAGGIVLGRRIIETENVILDTITSPMPSDRRGRTRFFRSMAGHQARIEQAWQDSGGSVNYLGEWHTHPEADPTPSCIDKWDWKRLVRAAEYEGDELFFFIVGIQTTKAWEVSKRRRKIVPLHQIARPRP